MERALVLEEEAGVLCQAFLVTSWSQALLAQHSQSDDNL